MRVVDIGEHPTNIDWRLLAHIFENGDVHIMVLFNCGMCGGRGLQRKRWVDANRLKNKRGPFCSRSCASKSRFIAWKKRVREEAK